LGYLLFAFEASLEELVFEVSQGQCLEFGFEVSSGFELRALGGGMLSVRDLQLMPVV
jgi:hypothetical protein